MAGTSSEWYARSFEKFLAHTDQTRVFVAELSRYIAHYRTHSILDIGAGNGALAVPISRRVEKYVAVERNRDHATRLRDCGVAVIEGSFPLPLTGSYDLVVMSHVISYEESNYGDLISAASERVAPGGCMLIVAHRGGAGSDWGRLLTRIGMDRFIHSPATIYDEIVSMLKGIGTVEAREVTTTVMADNAQDMLEVLAFTAPSGHYQEFMKNGNELAGILNSEYRTDTGYSFPFCNNFVSIHGIR